LFEDSKNYKDRSQFAKTNILIILFKYEMISQPSHILPSAGLNLRHKFQTPGKGDSRDRAVESRHQAKNHRFSTYYFPAVKSRHQVQDHWEQLLLLPSPIPAPYSITLYLY